MDLSGLVFRYGEHWEESISHDAPSVYCLSEGIISIPSNDMQEDDEMPPFIGHV